jgi:ankyrin repeat protein
MTISIANEHLRAAIARDDLDDARRTLSSGADPNGDIDTYGTSMLVYAIEQDASRALVNLLISKGAAVTSTDPSAKDPLHAAAGRGNLAVCEELVNRGAKIDRISEKGETALHAASFNARVEVCEYLIRAGANVRIEDKRGQTPLHYAARSLTGDCCVRCAGLLIAHGASSAHLTAAPLPGDLTPFQLAISYGNAPFVEYMIDQCGEDPSQRTHAGKTLEQIAVGDAVRLLLRAAQTSLAVSKSIDDDPSAATGARSTSSPSPL